VSGCGAAPSSTPTPTPTIDAGNAPEYYLSLGDSLSVGDQPNKLGISLPTSHGYPDQLQALLRGDGRVLSLVKLGCPGETTGTLIHGGLCRYAGGKRYSLGESAGSQLAAALSFLRAHRGHVPVITIDIGANDLAPCLDRASAAAPSTSSAAAVNTVAACAKPAIAMAQLNLVTILASLRAADPRAMIAGMTYYVPLLAGWLSGTKGRAYAVGSLVLVTESNAALTTAFNESQARVADVFAAFKSTDLSATSALPGSGTVPRAVALVCAWTWACAAPPVGPNAHANTTGYGVIAATFYAALRG
jgi:lysophospholipase L1-like esterase